jgi:simple sugar transport system permease protein
MDISAASIAARTISNATPLVIAGVGGIMCERSGVVNIGVEGTMLSGAFAAAAGSFVSGNPWIGLFCGIAAAMLISLLHAYLCVSLKLNHIISGLAINIFASSMTVYLLAVFWNSSGNSPAVPQLPLLSLQEAAKLPVLGELLKSVSMITLAGIFVVAFIHFALHQTAFGLHVIASGKNPLAAAVVGIRIARVQYISVLIGGFCSGMAGAFLSISYLNLFVKNMTAGRGFIAIATIIFGRYNPLGVAVAGLTFGFLDALQMALQGTVNIPPEIVQSIPYCITILAVVLASRTQYRREF